MLRRKKVTYLHCADQPLFDHVVESVRERGFDVVTYTESTHAQLLTDPEILAKALLSLV